MVAPTAVKPTATHPFTGRDVPWLLATQAAARAEHPFLVWEPFDGDGYTWTYREFAEAVARVAAGLADHGVTAGDRVLVHLGNCPEFLAAWFASPVLAWWVSLPLVRRESGLSAAQTQFLGQPARRGHGVVGVHLHGERVCRVNQLGQQGKDGLTAGGAQPPFPAPMVRRSGSQVPQRLSRFRPAPRHRLGSGQQRLADEPFRQVAAQRAQPPRSPRFGIEDRLHQDGQRRRCSHVSRHGHYQ